MAVKHVNIILTAICGFVVGAIAVSAAVHLWPDILGRIYPILPNAVTAGAAVIGVVFAMITLGGTKKDFNIRIEPFITINMDEVGMDEAGAGEADSRKFSPTFTVRNSGQFGCYITKIERHWNLYENQEMTGGPVKTTDCKSATERLKRKYSKPCFMTLGASATSDKIRSLWVGAKNDFGFSEDDLKSGGLFINIVLTYTNIERSQSWKQGFMYKLDGDGFSIPFPNDNIEKYFYRVPLMQ